MSPKLKFAKESAKRSQDDLEEALTMVSDLEKVWEEVKMKYLKVPTRCVIYE